MQYLKKKVKLSLQRCSGLCCKYEMYSLIYLTAFIKFNPHNYSENLTDIRAFSHFKYHLHREVVCVNMDRIRSMPTKSESDLSRKTLTWLHAGKKKLKQPKLIKVVAD